MSTTVYGPVIGGDGTPYGKTYWSVRATEDGVEQAFVTGSRLGVEVRKNGIAIARVGCNELSGSLMLDDGVLRFELRFRTQMGCSPALEAQDDWFVGLVQREHAWVVDGDTLTLTSGGTTIVLLDRRIAETDLPLDGTTWISPTYRKDRAALEQAVLENLRTPLTYSIESNRLELRGPTGATGLNLTAVRPDGDPHGSW